MRGTLRVGLEGTLRREVTPELLADHYGNPGVRVLATPALCWLFEQSAVLTVHDHLDPGESTVGARLEIEHLAPTPPGMPVLVRARLDSVDGRRLRFTIEAQDDREVVARGHHERFVVQLERFLDRARAKAATEG